MKTIQKETENILIIKNSKFITVIKAIDNKDDLGSIMQYIENKYKNATHYCYAYIINDLKHYDDDGEPSGTAGSPILNVLEKNNLTNVICIVIRYFGGIKLGAGGLIRTYGKCAREILTLAELFDVFEGYKIAFQFSYDNLKKIDSLINKTNIIKKDFDSLITYTILIKKDQLNLIDKLELENANILEIKKDYYIE